MKNEINRALVAKKARIFVLAAAMICAVSMAANNKVSGVIKDAADKTALIGVNVSLKQGDQQVSGTVTDAHGKFSLETETGEFVLECSYNGLTDMCNYRSTFLILLSQSAHSSAMSAISFI